MGKGVVFRSEQSIQELLHFIMVLSWCINLAQPTTLNRVKNDNFLRKANILKKNTNIRYKLDSQQRSHVYFTR